MQPIDWIIVGALLLLLVWAAATTRKYTDSVSAFLAAERCGGRYLIAVADEMSKLGVITLVWYFELNYRVGFTSVWWTLMEGPAWIILAVSGWVIYRYRQTRAMTLAEFFERRYSRRFRVFAGLLAFLAGIINFGIFPSVGARFFIALCGLPEAFSLGGMTVATFPVIMVALLAFSAGLTLFGGQIAVMVTDFLQGIIANVVFIVVMLFLLVTIGWDRISSVLLAAPVEDSLVQPFHLGKEQYFNVWYYVIGVVVLFYCARGWQGTQGYNCAAINAHEAKMATILAGWRWRVLMLITLVVPICVRTVMQHPDFHAGAATVQQALDTIHTDNPNVREALTNQLRTPLALHVMLPTGLIGLMCAAMLAAFVSTHDTYLHSWGSILIQDVALPFRKKPLSERAHLRLLRLAVVGVAVFAFGFSLVFQHAQYIAMFLALTGSIFVSGAGAAIIGGLYWKRGTTSAAWCAMITGMVLSTAGIIVKQLNPLDLAAPSSQGTLAGVLQGLVLALQERLTGQEMLFWAIVGSAGVYVLVSLYGPQDAPDEVGPGDRSDAAEFDWWRRSVTNGSGRTEFNLNRLLYRGEYADPSGDAAKRDERPSWLTRLGLTNEFTGADRVVTYLSAGWPLVWTFVFVAVTVYNLAVDTSPQSWATYWHIWTWFTLVCATIVTVWFAVGGFFDLRSLYASLRSRHEDSNRDRRQ